MTTVADLDRITEHLTTLARQVGLKVLLVPVDEQPMSFGTAVRTDLGVTEPPGALTMTWIETADPAEAVEVEERGAAIVESLVVQPGFIGFVGTSFAGRGHTFSAWTTPEAAAATIAGNRDHREARKRFLHGSIGRRGFTSIWVPWRLNAQLLRCPGCGARQAVKPGERATRCRCGTQPEVASYF